MAKTTTVTRGQYGEINQCLGALDAYKNARALLNAAVMANKLEAEYCDVDRKHRGSALNYSLYDVEIVRGKVVAALFQARQTECTKWGNSPQKDYLIIRKNGRSKVPSVTWLGDAQKLRVVRLSRHSLVAGEVIEVLMRQVSLPAAA